MMEALLVLEDGRTFPCRSFTGPGEIGGEIVFNTGMTGYQEVLTDPSYNGQMVTMTYPLVGNYGVNPEDIESDRIQVAAFLVKEYQRFPSNYRSTGTLADYLKSQKVLGIEDFDTRALTRHIRTAGAMRAYVSTEDLDPGSLIKKANAIPGMAGQDLARRVSTESPYCWRSGKPIPISPESKLDRSIWRASDLVGDFDGIGQVSFKDFLSFAGGFGAKPTAEGHNPRLDINADGRINFQDFLLFAKHFDESVY